MSHDSNNQPNAIRFLFENSAFLIAGAVLALVWANIDAQTGKHSHHDFFEADLVALITGQEAEHGDEHHEEGGEEHHAEEHEDEEGSGEPAGESSEAPTEPDESGGSDEETETQVGAANHSDADDHSSEDDESEEHGGGHGHHFNLHFLINDILMALFFAIAGKEVWESLLPGGALSNPRKAATPLLATLGGIVGPAGLYLVGALVIGQIGELGRGWAIPCATDIAFSYLVARIIFGNGHPGIAFLLLLAIADDAAGLVILAVAYSESTLMQYLWLLLTVAAVGLGFIFRRMRLQSFWWYLLIPGVLSWYSFYMAGVHPALGLVPIIPTLPHAHTDLGIFAIKELDRHDTLNEFEHFFKYPVELILGLFGLCNAGVAFSSVGAGTWLVLAGLLVGKPVGIAGFTFIAQKVFGLQIPEGMNYRDIFVLGCIAGIGFTVALFVSVAAFPGGGAVLDSVKMGALLSFGAAIVSFIAAKILGVKPFKPNADEQPSA